MSDLWKMGTSPESAGVALRAKVKDIKADVNRKVASRGARAVNALRNAELEVLKGQRSGKRYRKPHTKTATYIASAPGEAPARRTGNLRLHWSGDVSTSGNSNGGMALDVTLESQEKYAAFLENGHGNVAARPFVDRIKEKAEPEIAKIFMEPYT